MDGILSRLWLNFFDPYFVPKQASMVVCGKMKLQHLVFHFAFFFMFMRVRVCFLFSLTGEVIYMMMMRWELILKTWMIPLSMILKMKMKVMAAVRTIYAAGMPMHLFARVEVFSLLNISTQNSYSVMLLV